MCWKQGGRAADGTLVALLCLVTAVLTLCMGAGICNAGTPAQPDSRPHKLPKRVGVGRSWWDPSRNCYVGEAVHMR
jgi:hypothetical protein